MRDDVALNIHLFVIDLLSYKFSERALRKCLRYVAGDV